MQDYKIALVNLENPVILSKILGPRLLWPLGRLLAFRPGRHLLRRILDLVERATGDVFGFINQELTCFADVFIF